MKKSVSHLLYPIIVMIAAMNFTISCTDEPETEKQAELPVLEDITVEIDEEGTIDFNAPLAWTMSSDREWFVLEQTSGEAGNQSVPYTVTEQDADFEKTTEANVRIVFSDDRYVSFKVTRGTAERIMTITSDEEGTQPIESIDMDKTMVNYLDQKTFYVTANYNWYYDTAGSPEWLVLNTLDGSLQGNAGETYEVSVYIDIDKAPVEAQTGNIVLTADDDETIKREIPVNFEGFGEYFKIVEVRNGQELANSYDGCTFTSDGFITQAGMVSDQNSVTLKMRSSEEYVFIVATEDASWGPSGLYIHYAYPYMPYAFAKGMEPWLNISKDTNTKTMLQSGLYTMSVDENTVQEGSQYSWRSGEKRVAKVLCIPTSVLEEDDPDIISANGNIDNTRLQNLLTSSTPVPYVGLSYTLKEEYVPYVVFDVVQEGSAGGSTDVEHVTITDLQPGYPGNLDAGDGNGNYVYTSSYTSTQSNLGILLEVNLPLSATEFKFQNSRQNPQTGEWEFSDCNWLTCSWTGVSNPYILNIYISKNVNAEQRDPYTIVILDGNNNQIGSLKIILANN